LKTKVAEIVPTLLKL